MSRELKTAATSLEQLTSMGLAILAVASGIYTYIGVKGLLDGSDFLVVGAAIAYSVAVSVAIYIFWTYMLRYYPLLSSPKSKFEMSISLFAGCFAIIAMSSWLNAAALAGSAAVEQHLAEYAEENRETLQRAYNKALSVQSLLPDVRVAAANFETIASKEQSSGEFTGLAGSGTVVQMLSQTAQGLREIEQQIVKSRTEATELHDLGADLLSQMGEIVNSQGPIEARSVEFAALASQLSAIISQLEQSSVGPAVKRLAENLNRGFVEPAASGATVEVRRRQNEVVESIRSSREEHAERLAAQADTLLSDEEFSPPRFVPVSTAEAVLKYWSDFAPSWAGAISIDLLPIVIVFSQAIVFAAIRRHEEPLPIEETMTLRDMETALGALNRIENHRAAFKTIEFPLTTNKILANDENGTSSPSDDTKADKRAGQSENMAASAESTAFELKVDEFNAVMTDGEQKTSDVIDAAETRETESSSKSSA